jgi:hypothetical protein
MNLLGHELWTGARTGAEADAVLRGGGLATSQEVAALVERAEGKERARGEPAGLDELRRRVIRED